MGLPELQTERLVLRPLTPADLDVYVERIFALADPQNIASWRVMEIVGQAYQKNAFFFGILPNIV